MDKNRKILIIDDDEDDRELFCDALHDVRDDIACLGFPGGESALKYLRSGKNDPPDYIFLDLNMPGMNGQDCLEEIKKIPKLKGIPVIIYSTAKQQENIEMMKRSGAACFLVKPHGYGKIIESIRYVIDRKWEDTPTFH
jgi:CheY-like chemotaxis protein